MRNTFGKEEKLKKRNLIADLFAKGKFISVPPIQLIYMETDHDSSYKIQAGVSVSKKRFNKAVQRNQIKRLLREAYRLNKQLIYESEDTKKHIFMFIYQGSRIPSFDEMNIKMRMLLEKFLKKNKSL